MSSSSAVKKRATKSDRTSNKIRLGLNDVSILTADAFYSPSKTIGAFPWAITARKSTFPHWKIPDISVACTKSEECRVWHCYATVEVNVMNQADGGVAWTMTKKFRFSNSDPELNCASITESFGLLNTHEVLRNGKFLVEASISEVKTVMDYFRCQPILDFLTQSEMFDCTLQLGEKKVYVNRQFLSLYSPDFKDLFFGEFKGTQAYFKFDDVDPDEFISLMQCLYHWGATLNENNVDGVLRLAHRFEITVMVDEAEAFLMGSQRMNSMDKLKLAEKFDLFSLKDQAIHSIDNLGDLRLIYASDAFSRQSKEIAMEKIAVKENEERERHSQDVNQEKEKTAEKKKKIN